MAKKETKKKEPEVNEELIQLWEEVEAKAKLLKTQENDLRILICGKLAAGKPKGTHTFQIGNKKIKIVVKENTTIDKDVLAVLQKDMSEEEKAVFRWTPEVIAANYKELEDTSNVDLCLITKPGMPSLEVVYPKANDEEG